MGRGKLQFGRSISPQLHWLPLRHCLGDENFGVLQERKYSPNFGLGNRFAAIFFSEDGLGMDAAVDQISVCCGLVLSVSGVMRAGIEGRARTNLAWLNQ